MTVNRITIGRVHNLGNYEHVRFEISVNLTEEDQPGACLAEIYDLLEDLDPTPPVSDYDYQRAKAALGRPDEEWEEWERGNLEHYQNTVNRFEEHRTRRRSAVEQLNQLKGTARYRDAKDDWED